MIKYLFDSGQFLIFKINNARGGAAAQRLR
jgi:hypothetical protein